MAETNTFTAVCGAPVEKWNHFEECVKQRDAEGNPVKGSLGIHFDIPENLANLLYEECHGSFDALLLKLGELPHTREKSKGTKDDHIRQVVAFMRLCEGGANEFFIKKGTSPLWLVRRVGHYRHDPTKLFSHRISYELVRKVTDQEKKKHFPKTITQIKSTYGTMAALLG